MSEELQDEKEKISKFHQEIQKNEENLKSKRKNLQ